MHLDAILVYLLAASLFLIAAAGEPLNAGRELLGRSEWQFDSSTPKSTMDCTPGHYPGPLCTVTNLTLDHRSKTFIVYNLENNPLKKWGAYLWEMEESGGKRPRCDQTVDEAYVFTFYFYFGTSNYFHLHLDTLFPIYSLLRHVEQAKAATERRRSIVLMPTVEKTRMRVGFAATVRACVLVWMCACTCHRKEKYLT